MSSLLSILAYRHYDQAHSLNSSSINQEGGLGLQTLVNQLRSELENMELARTTSGDFFKLKDFDLELEFVVKRSSKETGKLEYQVVTAEMERELGSERTNKVTLHMEMAPKQTILNFPPETTLDSSGASRIVP